ncbi:MAG: HAD family hydrolase [Bellilinea sp.]
MALDTARIAAILFDVDGTLSDTDDQWVHRINRLLHFFRAVFPYRQTLPASRWLVMGMETPGNWMFELLDRLHLDDEARQLANALARRSRDHDQRFLLIPQVDEMLAALAVRYPLGVVSARGELATQHFLKQYGLSSSFGAVATALTCRYTKPFPDPVIWAAGQLGVPPERCLMVGDTTVDIRAGKAAGAQTVGVLCGFGSERELRRAGADLILPSTADLGKVLLTVKE